MDIFWNHTFTVILKTLQVLWCRLTFTFHLIDNKKLKNTMEGECDPTGNNENSGIIKDFSIIPLQ